MINPINTSSLKVINKRIEVCEQFDHNKEMESVSNAARWFIGSILSFGVSMFFISPLILWFFVGLAEVIVSSTAAALGHPQPPILNSPQGFLNVMGAISGGFVGCAIAFIMTAFSWARTLSKRYRDEVMLPRLKARKEKA